MIILPLGLTSEEIRVLQEFRRLNADVLTVDKIDAVKHPAGPGGQAPAMSLVTKGWLETDGSRESFTLTQKSREFLAIDARPMFEETAGSAAPAGSEIAPAEAV